jgi:hypothetical protein
VVPAALYLMTAWLVGAALGQEPPSSMFGALRRTVEAFRLNPGLTLWVIALVAVFVTFTDTASRVHRWVGGGLHFLAHWIAIFVLGVGSAATSRFLPEEWVVSRFGYETVFMFVGGWVVGSLIMGLYLLVSLNVFGRHSEEAFSAMRIEDFKHFLRLHVASDGTLTIYPIKIERVPRRWRDRRVGDTTPSRVVPDEPFRVELIEAPIVVRGGAPSLDPGRARLTHAPLPHRRGASYFLIHPHPRDGHGNAADLLLEEWQRGVHLGVGQLGQLGHFRQPAGRSGAGQVRRGSRQEEGQGRCRDAAQLGAGGKPRVLRHEL